MWIFGYGSLMWDGWEQRIGFQRHVIATLHGYRRVFNKASVRNWGDRRHPGPTLNIETCEGEACKGVAFEFTDHSRDGVLAYLREREGHGFALREPKVYAPDENEVVAIVPVYEGPNILASRGLRDLGAQVRAAKGTSGPCVDYVTGVARELSRLSIDDPAVTNLYNEFERGRGTMNG
jgi:glutathione-specific gamma-glutamylcyclotransferase